MRHAYGCEAAQGTVSSGLEFRTCSGRTRIVAALGLLEQPQGNDVHRQAYMCDSNGAWSVYPSKRAYSLGYPLYKTQGSRRPVELDRRLVRMRLGYEAGIHPGIVQGVTTRRRSTYLL